MFHLSAGHQRKTHSAEFIQQRERSYWLWYHCKKCSTKINALPVSLSPTRLDEGNGIKCTWTRIRAKYHSSCKLIFNNTQLERAHNRASTDISMSKCQENPIPWKLCALSVKMGGNIPLKKSATSPLIIRIRIRNPLMSCRWENVFVAAAEYYKNKSNSKPDNITKKERK